MIQRDAGASAGHAGSVHTPSVTRSPARVMTSRDPTDPPLGQVAINVTAPGSRPVNSNAPSRATGRGAVVPPGATANTITWSTSSPSDSTRPCADELDPLRAASIAPQPSMGDDGAGTSRPADVIPAPTGRTPPARP